VDTLQTMRVFVRVAQLSGFAAAARELRMSPAAVTKHVAAAEDRVNARLFDRTTRRVALTEAGRVYLERCVDALQAVEDAEDAVVTVTKVPRGILRVAAPVDLQRWLAPIVTAFSRANPSVMLDVRLSNRVVDIVEEGIDVAIRIAPALDGSYVARPLGDVGPLLVASPAYLRAHGHPRRPADLAKHRALVFSEPRWLDELTLARGPRKTLVKLSPVLLSNNGESLRAAAIDGIGISLRLTYLVADDIAAGRLERVLPEWSIVPTFRLWAAYPHRRYSTAKVRAFLETVTRSTARNP